jgi:hypothetical protein
LYHCVRITYNSDPQGVKDHDRAGRLKPEQVAILDLIGDSFQALLRASLGGEVEVLSSGERGEFRSGVPPQGIDHQQQLRGPLKRRSMVQVHGIRYGRRGWVCLRRRRLGALGGLMPERKSSMSSSLAGENATE